MKCLFTCEHVSLRLGSNLKTLILQPNVSKGKVMLEVFCTRDLISVELEDVHCGCMKIGNKNQEDCKETSCLSGESLNQGQRGEECRESNKTRCHATCLWRCNWACNARVLP